jgi:hypothetical protein
LIRLRGLSPGLPIASITPFKRHGEVIGCRRQKEAFLTKVRPVIDEIKSTGISILMGIADSLNRRGIPTRTGKPVWFASTVKTVVG